MGGPVMRNTIMTNPAFYYPPLPYTCNIPGGLAVHKNITMRGSIPKNANRFEISFMAGQDIALYINPRIKPWTYVVRNSLLNDQWGTEERDLPFNPFQPGKCFELSIRCGNHTFQVYTNGRHLFNFTYRYVPIERIQTIKIIGDVTLSYIKY
ncbi:galectin-4-like [Erythrolamprus reginae]|uniref:galectin-4-like n=1 Tax=Erythrolamprus reginae TaxID=121349 RepID=UPI00396C6594